MTPKAWTATRSRWPPLSSDVEIVEPAGSDTFVVIQVAGKELTARMRADTVVGVGQKHTFAFNLDKAVLFDPSTTRRI